MRQEDERENEEEYENEFPAGEIKLVLALVLSEKINEIRQLESPPGH
jgi:hypothetical protein